MPGMDRRGKALAGKVWDGMVDTKDSDGKGKTLGMRGSGGAAASTTEADGPAGSAIRARSLCLTR